MHIIRLPGMVSMPADTIVKPMDSSSAGKRLARGRESVE